jgi:hypothetical protein
MKNPLKPPFPLCRATFRAADSQAFSTSPGSDFPSSDLKERQASRCGPLSRPALILGILGIFLTIAGWSTPSLSAQQPPPTTRPNNDPLTEAIKALGDLKSGGIGHPAAITGAERLQQLPGERLGELLLAMDQADPVARNWIRGVVSGWLDRQPAADRPTIVDQLYGVWSQRDYGVSSREFAFELLVTLDPVLAGKILPDLIHDSSPKLVALGINWQLQQAAETDDPGQRLAILALAFSKGIDIPQLQTISQQLQSLGVMVDLNRQLGFLTSWQLVSGFENLQEEGLHTSYPPEADPAQINFQDRYPLTEDRSTAWTWHHSVSPLGVVNLNQLLGKAPNQVAYAVANFYSSEVRKVELKVASPNALKVWVNGELLLTNELYHNGNAVDKFSIPALLRPGNNTLMVKVCQNDQPESWAQDWEFRLRVCDLKGRGLIADQPPSRRGDGG